MTTYECISCRSTNLELIISFGKTPLSDRLLTFHELKISQKTELLEWIMCHDCHLVQLSKQVPREELFDDRYPYLSSIPQELSLHTYNNAQELMSTLGLNRNSMVIEIASNDGYMLRYFKEKHIPTLGIDPSSIPAQIAQGLGITTLQTFFNSLLARQLVKKGYKADVLIAKNILAHVIELNDFVYGMKIILDKKGTLVVEVPYLLDLIDHVEFDTIYHQHLCYFSLSSLMPLFKRHTLYINKVEKIKIHGGSIRLSINHFDQKDSSIDEMYDKERERSIFSIRSFNTFKIRVSEVKVRLQKLLLDLKSNGAKIAGYGAAAKANSLISYCQLDQTLIDYIVDKNPEKHGLFISSYKIPIHPPSRLLQIFPDYLVIFAWNFKDEIIEQQKTYIEMGGRIIIPLPEPMIL